MEKGLDEEIHFFYVMRVSTMLDDNSTEELGLQVHATMPS